MNGKLLIFGFILFFNITGFSQVIALEQPELMVLYRGYENRIYVNIPEDLDVSPDEIQVGGTNCEISKANLPGCYIVKPDSGKSVVLTLKFESEDTLQEIYRAEYHVSNLPDPMLYWGPSKSGEKGSKSSRALIAKYTREIGLKANFSITKWTITHNGLIVTGIGGNLNRAHSLISSIKPGEQLAITAIVVGPDGIERQIGGAWSL